MQFNFNHSKTFTVIYTEVYRLGYRKRTLSASIIIPDDFFSVENYSSKLTFYDLEGKHLQATLNVYLKKDLSLKEAYKLFKDLYQEDASWYLFDDLSPMIICKNKEVDWSAEVTKLYSYQEELNKSKWNEIKKERNKMNKNFVDEVLSKLTYENFEDFIKDNRKDLLVKHINPKGYTITIYSNNKHNLLFKFSFNSESGYIYHKKLGETGYIRYKFNPELFLNYFNIKNHPTNYDFIKENTITEDDEKYIYGMTKLDTELVKKVIKQSDKMNLTYNQFKQFVDFIEKEL